MQRRSLAPPALGPVGLDLHHLVRIIERMLVVLQRGKGARSVRVEHVIRGIELDSLCEFVAAGSSVGCRNGAGGLGGEGTYMDSANFFSAKSLLPSALSASAMMAVCKCVYTGGRREVRV